MAWIYKYSIYLLKKKKKEMKNSNEGYSLKNEIES